MSKGSHRTVGIKVFLWMIEGSGSGSIPLTNGSESRSGRSKNMWIRWIRIRIRIRNNGSSHFSSPCHVHLVRIHLHRFGLAPVALFEPLFILASPCWLPTSGRLVGCQGSTAVTAKEYFCGSVSAKLCLSGPWPVIYICHLKDLSQLTSHDNFVDPNLQKIKRVRVWFSLKFASRRDCE